MQMAVIDEGIATIPQYTKGFGSFLSMAPETPWGGGRVPQKHTPRICIGEGLCPTFVRDERGPSKAPAYCGMIASCNASVSWPPKNSVSRAAQEAFVTTCFILLCMCGIGFRQKSPSQTERHSLCFEWRLPTNLLAHCSVGERLFLPRGWAGGLQSSPQTCNIRQLNGRFKATIVV